MENSKQKATLAHGPPPFIRTRVYFVICVGSSPSPHNAAAGIQIKAPAEGGRVHVHLKAGEQVVEKLSSGGEVEKNPLRNSSTDGFLESMIIVVRESTGE